MNEEINIIPWIQQWFANQCDGDWEHQYGIAITTLDNPGWKVDINLYRTQAEGIQIAYTLIDNSEEDWYTIEIKESVFYGHGDPSKLELLLKKFREIIEKYEQP